MKILLDTNALIDLVAVRKPYVNDIKKLCIAAVFGDLQIWVSTQSYADAYYVLRKHASAEEVKHALLATLDIFMVCGTYAEDFRRALESDWNNIEDYLIAHASKHIPAKYLITRDKKLIERSPINAMSAQEFLGMLERDYGLAYDEGSLK